MTKVTFIKKKKKTLVPSTKLNNFLFIFIVESSSVVSFSHKKMFDTNNNLKSLLYFIHHTLKPMSIY